VLGNYLQRSSQLLLMNVFHRMSLERRIFSRTAELLIYETENRNCGISTSIVNPLMITSVILKREMSCGT